MLRESVDVESLLARRLTLDSPAVVASAELGAYAAPSFPDGRPLTEAVADLTSRIHRDFVFDPAATDVTTPVGDLLTLRRGVCQDFAHLAIGCLRSMGLPARYVSGYLETEPPPDAPKLAGADMSHAWFATFLPGWGWIDADPTNDQLPCRGVVVGAWGRDYRDVAPIRGVLHGPMTRQALYVSVDVMRLD
jgi:transglutaminase-like putative cysteine protease